MHFIKMVISLLLVAAATTTTSCSGTVPPEPPAPLPPQSRVPAAPNDSVVTAKVIAVISLPNGKAGEIVIEVQKAETIPGMINAMTSRVGEQVTINTDEDVSQFKKGQIISANVRLVGDERSHFYSASGIR